MDSFPQRAPRPEPATVSNPTQLCVQCNWRIAKVGEVGCGKCKRMCINCKTKLRYGKRYMCYDCLWSAATPNSPACEKCGMPAENGGKKSRRHICGACYRKEAYYNNKRKEAPRSPTEDDDDGERDANKRPRYNEAQA